MAVKNAADIRPRLSLTNVAEVVRIHESSLALLERVGIAVHYPPARSLLRSHGAEVDEARHLVRIPRGLVVRALEHAPSSMTIYAESEPSRDCSLDWGGGQYARPATGLNWVLDSRANRRRAVTEADVVNWTRVAHALPNMNFAASAYDQEGPPNSMDVRSVAKMLTYTDKPLIVSALSGEGMRWIQRLTEVTQAEGRQPRVMVLSSVNSPLFYAYGQAEAAMVSAELGIAVLCGSSAIAGVTAPTTLSGALLQMNAEILAAITIVQLHRPGALVVYFGHPMALDMRTGMASIGFPEAGLLAAALVDMGRFYGLPTSSSGAATDAHVPDAMALAEKVTTAFLPALAGAQISGGGGALGCVSTISLEQLAIDDDIFGRIFRQVRGFRLDVGTLAEDLVTSVGPTGSYLVEEHTLNHFRSEHWYSPLTDGLGAAAWEAAGSRTVVDRASDKVRAILDVPAEPVVSPDQARAISDLLAHAEAALRSIELPG